MAPSPSAGSEAIRTPRSAAFALQRAIPAPAPRARAPRPAPAVRCRRCSPGPITQEDVDDAAEATRLLDVCEVAGAFEHDQPGVGDEPLHDRRASKRRLGRAVTPNEQ